MIALQVKGKSTGPNLRAVYVLIDKDVANAIDRMLEIKSNSSEVPEYLFAR
jgi:hypothetical protein